MAFTDAFTGTNDTTLTAHDAKWVQGTSPGGVMEIQSNAAAGNVGAAETFYYYNDTFAEAHYSQAVVAAADTEAIGPIIRASTSAKSFYYCALYHPGTAVFPGQCVAGTSTDWDSGQSEAVVGNTFGLYVDSGTTTTIYYKKNSSTIATYTSKNALSGGKAGVWFFQGQTATRIDDWEGGDVGGAAASKPKMLALMGVC